MKDLKSAFTERDRFYSNRASCIFPIHLENKECDLYIIFLNYWSIKNNISSKQLLLNLRIYNTNGSLICRHTLDDFKNHNQISVRDILNYYVKNIVDFYGSVEFEIISLANIRFPFPAVVGVFRSGNLYSAVHAAGRIKNPDETHAISTTEESNWNCKSNEEITAFFHFFNGPSLPTEKKLYITLRSENGVAIEKKIISIEDIPPYGSRIFFMDEIFKRSEIKKGYFFSVKIEHNSIFPRLVVGNYFRKHSFLEVTHSFPIIENNDYCQINSNEESQSILCAYKSNELDLDVVVFPTNCEGQFNLDIWHQKYGDLSLKVKDKSKVISTHENSNTLRFKLEEDEEFLCLHMSGKSVPSRFNASFVYKVKNVVSNFSTDIASGAKSSIYPAKFRHWGHGLVSNGFESLILIRNNSHTPKKTELANAKLSLFLNENKFEYTFDVNKESSRSIKISDIYDLSKIKHSNKNPIFISWLIETNVKNCETFWISFRDSDGAILGEHGF